MRIKLDTGTLLAQLAALPNNARAVTGVTMILVLLLAFSAARLTWKILPAPALQPLAPLPGQSTSQPRDTAGQRTDLAGLHLFGFKPKQPVVAQQPEKIPETKLNLILRGVVADADGGSSGAIISAPGSDEQYYALEEQVPGGAVLKEVHPDHVVLLRNGSFETLRLPKDELDNSSAVPEPRNPPASLSGFKSLQQYRDTMINNPQAMADIIRYTPVPTPGGGSGFLVSPGRDRELFTRAGLEPGDIVTAVNGIELDSQPKILSALRIMSQTDEIQLRIQRHGVPQTIVVNMNQ